MSLVPSTARLGRLLGLFSAVLISVGLLAAPAGAQSATADKIEPALAASLDADGTAEFMVYFTEQADTSSARDIADWTQRGQAVMTARQQLAERSQAAARAELDKTGVDYQSFWIVNAIHVRNGTAALAARLAADPAVASLNTPTVYQIPEPKAGDVEEQVNAVEWGIAAIRADQAWADFGATGEGIVVANIDTGVQFDHSALVNQYRGNNGDGTFNHNYNWHDPSSVCGSPSTAPCDNHGHGTHTMGTMVGYDGGANQVGVAPDATWIAAKGCESGSCSTNALLSSGEWIAAPTDLSGANPRPDLRPHVVNNSWGGRYSAISDPWYQHIVDAWNDAGVFPAFSSGNGGPGCQTTGTPGGYENSYASGAFDISGNIASFSSRGDIDGGRIKPNLSSPGVNVRSSVPGNGYGSNSGTSMASPHTAGAVALVWSAAASMVGDVDGTEELLNQTAVDTSDTTCGGSAENNNVWGEGKLDAYAAVDQAPRGPTGTLTGTVTDAADNSPIAGAQITVTGDAERSTRTGDDGTYTVRLPAGNYTVSAAAFGYGSDSASVTVAADQTTTQDFGLTAADNYTVSGNVVSGTGDPVANATVQIEGTPFQPVTTGADGAFSFENVPAGSYTISATAGGCFDGLSQDVDVSGDLTLDFELPQRSDSFGYSCVVDAGGYTEGDTPVALTGDDVATSIDLPFSFPFYGGSYGQAFVSSNGHVNFLSSSTSYSNVAIPASGVPNAAIYPLWDDLVIATDSQLSTGLSGAAPDREFVIEWRNVHFYANTGLRVDFAVVLGEDGSVQTQYRNLDPAQSRESGDSATVGIENADGSVALQYSYNEPVLSDDLSVQFLPPPSGVVTGVVTDANDGQPVAGATVTVAKDGEQMASLTTADDGTYSTHLLLGDYTLEAGKDLYSTESAGVSVVTDGETVTANFMLATPLAAYTPDSASWVVAEGMRTTRIVLSSQTEQALTFQASSDQPWMWVVPGSGVVAGGADRNLTVRLDPDGVQPGVHEGTITLTTNAGRTPAIEVPVTMVVPAYQAGLNSGGADAADTVGDLWHGDTEWSPDGYGYLSEGWVNSTGLTISGTDDQALFNTQRENFAGYRFDALPAGEYQVQLNFAELRGNLPAGRRVFDVKINGELVLYSYDIVASVGNGTADQHEFWVTVPGSGSISVQLVPRRGYLQPVMNSIRVTERPDHG